MIKIYYLVILQTACLTERKFRKWLLILITINLQGKEIIKIYEYFAAFFYFEINVFLGYKRHDKNINPFFYANKVVLFIIIDLYDNELLSYLNKSI